MLSKNMQLVAVLPLKSRQSTGKQYTASSRLVTKLVLSLHPQTFDSLCVNFSLLGVKKVMSRHNNFVSIHATDNMIHSISSPLVSYDSSSWKNMIDDDLGDSTRRTDFMVYMYWHLVQSLLLGIKPTISTAPCDCPYYYDIWSTGPRSCLPEKRSSRLTT